MRTKDDLDKFKLKDIVQMKMVVSRMAIKVQMAFVSRVDEQKLELGINYNIFENKMVSDDNAYYLSSIIYNWIKELIKEHGHIKED